MTLLPSVLFLYCFSSMLPHCLPNTIVGVPDTTSYVMRDLLLKYTLETQLNKDSCIDPIINTDSFNLSEVVALQMQGLQISIQSVYSPGENVSIPALQGELAIVFHMDQLQSLVVAEAVLASIFLGTITNWRDLQPWNPNIILPDRQIRRVQRADKTDLNRLLQTALHHLAVSETSYQSQTVKESVLWSEPEIYANTSIGMLGTILAVPDTLGYCLMNEAVALNLPHIILLSSDTLSDTEEKTIELLVYVNLPPIATESDCLNLKDIAGFIEWMLESPFVQQHLPTGLSQLSASTAVEAKELLNNFIANTKCNFRIIQDRTSSRIFVPIWLFSVTTGIILSLLGLLMCLICLKANGLLWKKADISLVDHVPRQEAKLSVGSGKRKRSSAVNGLFGLQAWLVPPESIKRLMIEVNQVLSRPVSAASQQDVEEYAEVADLRTKAKMGMLDEEFVSAFESCTQSDPGAYVNVTKRKLNEFVTGISHENVTKFLGIHLHSKIVYYIFEQGRKGTLHYILKYSRYPLEQDLKLAFLADAVHGMEYLHSKRVIHGRLSSFTCYLDSKWTLKVTDWVQTTVTTLEDRAGLSQINGNKLLQKKMKVMQEDYIRLLYMEPDLICAPDQERTWLNDVYSFGVLMIEIFTRTHPFAKELQEGNSFEEIFKQVASSYIRPSIPDSIPDALRDLIQLSLHDRSERLSFSQIIKFLKEHKLTVNKGVVESIMEVMEEYMANLEDKVEERTKELKAVTAKIENLLCSILPRDVAQKLQNGEVVEPEFYDHVSIYFSDIVGFTNISSESSPLEVVNFLNGLYTYFDEIIDHFDVYKVETIGDAYMVVSGLPKRNGMQHAAEITKMAIMLVLKCRLFVIPHRSDMQLKIRVGLNSGPVMAGVVGLKMPRYCLFGDAVNTASRMESTSLPLKIQATEHLIKFLQHFPEFKYDLRGNVEIKGKGTMNTYWIHDDIPEEVLLGEKQISAIRKASVIGEEDRVAELMNSNRNLIRSDCMYQQFVNELI